MVVKMNPYMNMNPHEIIGIIISKELYLWNYWNPYEIIISAEYEIYNQW